LQLQIRIDEVRQYSARLSKLKDKAVPKMEARLRDLEEEFSRYMARRYRPHPKKHIIVIIGGME